MVNMSPGSHSVDPKYLQYSGENEVKRNVHYNTHDMSYTSYTDDPTWQAMAIKSHHNLNGTQAFGNSGVLYEEGSRFQNVPNNFWMNKRNTFIGQTHSQNGSVTNLIGGDQLNQSAISLDHQYDTSFAK